MLIHTHTKQPAVLHALTWPRADEDEVPGRDDGPVPAFCCSLLPRRAARLLTAPAACCTLSPAR
jgi:hypothetical protein